MIFISFLLFTLTFGNDLIQNDVKFHFFNENDQNNHKDDLISFLIQKNLLDKSDVFEISEDTNPITKIKHYKFSQKHQGIEVFGRGARVHFNSQNKLSTFSSNFFRGNFESFIPSINQINLEKQLYNYDAFYYATIGAGVN